jgi:acyl-coenzyme A synthetase/AMP-(fatty) acid ligase
MTKLHSIHEILCGRAARQGGGEAIAGEIGRVTYAEILLRIETLAGWMVDSGLDPAVPAGVSLADEKQHLLSAITLLCLGVPSVNLPTHETADNRRAIAAKVGASQVIAAYREPWMEGLQVFTPPVEAYEGKAVGFAVPAFPARPFDAPAIYVSTSGSTQVPKAFALSLERILMIARSRAADPYERRVLRTSTVEYDSSRVHRVCALVAGNTCVFSSQIDLDSIVKTCARAEVTDVQIGTYKLTSLLNAAGAGVHRLPASTRINTGGSRVPGPLRERVRNMLTENLWVAYATSEIGVISVARPEEHAAFPEGVGHPIEGVEVEIVDEEGNPVLPGEVGRARIRKAAAPAAYLGDRDVSGTFRDGWFYPGDLLSRHESEPLIYHGRVDDVMILNGINVFPSAIEDVLESQPGVLEAVAYPVASRIHGEIPVAAVVLTPEARERGTAHLMDLCRERLGIRAPRRIVAVDAIPRNKAGKPLRRELARS